MPDFAYTARDVRGEKVSGTITASTEREVVSALSGRSLFPVAIAADKSVRSYAGGRRVGAAVMATLYSQMASLMRSGVPLLRAISVLRDQSTNAALKDVLGKVHDRVEEGENLSEAMARHPKAFSEMAVNLVRAGGEGGFLEDALDRVAQFTEQQQDLKSRTIGAMAYPAFLAVVGTLVVSGLLIFLVPMFASMFDELRKQNELPFLTEVLLWLSNTLKEKGLLVLLGVGLVFAYLRSQLATEKGRLLRDRYKLRIPMAGGIFQSLAVARFCRVLGTLLQNGVPILKSLEISSGAAGNRIISMAIQEASENISSGQSLAAPLKSSGHFPATVIEMISIAEESNSLDKVLVEIADGLERRTSRRLDLMVRLLEPMMLLILAVVVLCVVIALLMPIIKMSTAI